MECVYKNFDGLDMAFHGVMDIETIEELERAKNAAAAAGEPVAVEVAGIALKVMETGRRGGWHYVLDTGEDGEIWAIKDAPKDGKGGWNITASARSAAFLQHGGLEAVHRRMLEKLDRWGFLPTPCPDSGRFDGVTRVDFAADFKIAKDWTLEPGNISNKGGKTGHYEEDTSFTATWSGRRNTGCTIGKMPNRQVCIYDKTAEVKAKQKDYWFEAWGLDPDDKEFRIWRVENRAGKRFLKDRFGVRSFEEVSACIGDIMADTLDNVRLVDPIDSNITRCPDAPLWQQVRAVVADGLKDMMAGLAPGVVKETTRERLSATMEKLLRGVALTYAAVDTGKMALPVLLEQIRRVSDGVIRQIESDAEETLKHVKRAQNRYRLIEVETWKRHKGRHQRPDIGTVSPG